uniref:ABC transmembrane type-1 domain-containing protein n=1 Tax=Chloropicon primus TaxID=1764295 RepID=A0A7S2WYT4_9CHLO|mmetsp:Transcript_2368/g.6560  ORF Transcript_2368/g.6560 Transcript_2368/m.6560 type:complete len:192 (+) Transcript_2368:93-668(+)
MDVESVSLLTRRHTEPTTLRSVTRRSTLALCAGEEEEISQGVGLGSVVAVIGPYFSSERRGSALLRLALVFALAAGHTALAVLTSYAERDMSTAMATRNQEEFWLALAKFVGIVAVVVPVAGGYYFTVSLSTLRFREWLTRHLVVLRKGRETSGVDNIDQRICEDAASFADRVIDLSLLTFSSPGSLTRRR